MKVVSDTTAVTTLLKVGRVDLLAVQFGRVLIPPAVEQELRAYHGTLPACCEVVKVSDSSQLLRLLAEADRGEAEAICLAVETGADALLIDDRKTRRLAEAQGLRCLSLPAVVLAAKQQGLIPSATVLLNELAQRGRFCLSERARQALLRQAGD